MKHLGNSEAKKEMKFGPGGGGGGCIPIYKLRSKHNPKRPTKSKMADKIQNGRQQIKMADM